MGVEPKNRGVYPPKMDGENNGKPYEQRDDLGVPLYIFGNSHIPFAPLSVWVARFINFHLADLQDSSGWSEIREKKLKWASKNTVFCSDFFCIDL